MWFLVELELPLLLLSNTLAVVLLLLRFWMPTLTAPFGVEFDDLDGIAVTFCRIFPSPAPVALLCGFSFSKSSIMGTTAPTTGMHGGEIISAAASVAFGFWFPDAAPVDWSISRRRRPKIPPPSPPKPPPKPPIPLWILKDIL